MLRSTSSSRSVACSTPWRSKTASYAALEARERRRVRRRGARSGVGPSELRDGELRAPFGRERRQRAEARSVVEALQHQHHHVGVLVLDDQLERIEHAHVGAVPTTDDAAEAHPERGAGAEDREAERATLRHDRDVARNGATEPSAEIGGRAERGTDRGVQVEEALAVGAEDAHAGLLRRLEHLLLERGTRGVVLGEAGAEDRHAGDAGIGALAHDVGHSRRGHDDHRQVDGFADRRHGRGRGQTGDRLVLGVDRDDAPGEPVGEQDVDGLSPVGREIG